MNSKNFSSSFFEQLNSPETHVKISKPFLADFQRNSLISEPLISETPWKNLPNLPPVIEDGVDNVLVGTTAIGEEEVDVLRGGAGANHFVSGTEATVFSQDSFAYSQGAFDFGLIVDFNVAKAIIQLQGNSTDYSLGSIQETLQQALSGLEGTGLYYQEIGTKPELIGILSGTQVITFDPMK